MSDFLLAYLMLAVWAHGLLSADRKSYREGIKGEMQRFFHAAITPPILVLGLFILAPVYMTIVASIALALVWAQ